MPCRRRRSTGSTQGAPAGGAAYDSAESGTYSIAKEAVKLRDGTYPPEKVERFFTSLLEARSQAPPEGQRSGRQRRPRGLHAESSRTRPRSFDDSPPRSADGTRPWFACRSHRHWRIGTAIALGASAESVRVNTVAGEERYELAMRAPEPVSGVVDMRVDEVERVRTIADSVLQRHKWHQRFNLGPISTRGPSDSHNKFDVIQPRGHQGQARRGPVLRHRGHRDHVQGGGCC